MKRTDYITCEWVSLFLQPIGFNEHNMLDGGGVGHCAFVNALRKAVHRFASNLFFFCIICFGGAVGISCVNY